MAQCKHKITVLHKPTSFWVNRAKFVASPTILLSLMVTLLYYLTYKSEDTTARTNIVAEADFLAGDITNGLTNYGKALKSLGDFYAITPNENRLTTFQELANDMIQLYPEIAGFSWNPIVSHSMRSTFERRMRQDEGSQFQITEVDKDGKLKPATQRSFYAPFTYIAPEQLREKWIGFDLNSIPQNQSAIQSAIDKSLVAISQPFDLIQDPTSPTGIMLVYPIKKRTKDPHTGKSAVQGFMVATIRIPEMIESISGKRIKLQHLDLHLDSRDGANFYDSLRPNNSKYQSYSQVRYLSGVDGAIWKLTVIPTEAYFAKFSEKNSSIGLIGGILFTSLFASFLLALVSRDERLTLETTEKMRTQAALARVEARKAAALEASLDAIIAIDCKGHIIDFNPSAEKMFMYKKEEVLGQDMSSKIIPERLRKAHQDGIIRYLNTGIPRILGARVEVFAMRSDGSEFPIEIAPVSLIIEGTTYFTGVVRDITERKVLEAKLKAAKDSAEAANEAKSTFLANMSHEIRTPLSAVLGFSNFMISKQLTDEERENYRQIIKRNGALLTNVIDDILDLSKVEAGKVEIEPRECEIHEVLNDIETLLTPQAKDKNLYLTIDIHTDVPRYIYTDSLRLRQILLNVVGNAVKFTEKGGVRVIVHIADTNPASSDIQFDVVDTGPGISAEGVSKIFQPFTQADPSMKRRFGGTGLGLVLAKKLSMLLGGDLSLTKTSVGVGSVFTILVAADLRSARQKNDQTLKIDRAMRPIVKPKDIVSTNGVNRLLGKRILVTEDAPDIRLMISSILNYSGACVENAENGREAIKLMHKKNFDAVLMDLQMPIMDGYEAIKRLREEGYSIPIIALTAHALDDQQEKCRDAGFNAHISKPISVERLVDTIANLTN